MVGSSLLFMERWLIWESQAAHTSEKMSEDKWDVTEGFVQIDCVWGGDDKGTSGE